MIVDKKNLEKWQTCTQKQQWLKKTKKSLVFLRIFFFYILEKWALSIGADRLLTYAEKQTAVFLYEGFSFVKSLIKNHLEIDMYVCYVYLASHPMVPGIGSSLLQPWIG